MGWLDIFKKKSLTVVIPLHKGKPYVDQISSNINNIPAGVQIILSDQTQEDDALKVLAERHARDPRITVRSKLSAPGWRIHANELIAETTTEYFSILAQDDIINSSYYPKLVSALRKNSKAGLAFGRIEVLDYRKASVERHFFSGPPFQLGRNPPWVDAIELDRQWNLGIPYRGVIRKRILQTIDETPGDRFADQIWVFGMALLEPMVEVADAIYTKPYHHNNIHTSWEPLVGDERLYFLRREIERRLGSDHESIAKLMQLNES